MPIFQLAVCRSRFVVRCWFLVACWLLLVVGGLLSWFGGMVGWLVSLSFFSICLFVVVVVIVAVVVAVGVVVVPVVVVIIIVVVDVVVVGVVDVAVVFVAKTVAFPAQKRPLVLKRLAIALVACSIGCLATCWAACVDWLLGCDFFLLALSRFLLAPCQPFCFLVVWLLFFLLVCLLPWFFFSWFTILILVFTILCRALCRGNENNLSRRQNFACLVYFCLLCRVFLLPCCSLARSLARLLACFCFCLLLLAFACLQPTLCFLFASSFSFLLWCRNRENILW